MRRFRGLVPFALVLLVAACATAPLPSPPTYEDDESYIVTPPPAPMIEYPPIEPVEPPPEPSTAPPPATAPATPAAPAVTFSPPAPAEAAVPAPPAPAPAEPSAEEVLMAALLADLQRYAALPPDDVRRELGAVTQTLARQRTDANRVRLAILYTLVHTNPQDDQRALQLLDNVAKSGPGSPGVKQLAVVLQVQISDRVRAVREEQQKADAAIQKLEALRAMERSLLRDRVRGGSGGGGGGSSGGGGGGGGSAGGH